MDEHSTHNGAPESSQDSTFSEDPKSALEVRSAEVQEIIGRPPHWLVRGGIAVFLGVLLLVFAAASTIEYPEIINAGITLNMEGASTTVTSQVDGTLTSLAVDNGEWVQRGESLGTMSPAGNHNETIQLTAPRNGTVFYKGILEEGQSVSDSLDLFFIRPDNASYYGELLIPESSFGKVEEGQTVLARFNGYPSEQYGSVEARIEYFPEVMVGNGMFVAKVSFPEGLTTNYGQQLVPVDGMTGQAEIITKDLKLLDRIYSNMTSQLN